MLIFTERCDDDSPPAGVARLPFDLRQRSRLRVEVIEGSLAGGVVGFDLPRGTILRSGDRVRCASGEVLRIEAAAEALAHVVAGSAPELARIAYHLGNRHVPVQVGDGWLRLQADGVLETMVAGLGAAVTRVDAPFEPEAGAYGHAGHGHSHGDSRDGSHGDSHDDSTPAGDAHRHPDAGPHRHAHPHGADGRHAPRIHDLLADRRSR